MENNKTSLSSKIITIAFCVLMVVLTVAAFIYLLTGPDFLTPQEYLELNPPPTTTVPEGEIDYTALYQEALYMGNMQDLFDYLQELGYIDPANKIPMSTIGTDNWICDGLDMMWWDVENLEEGTEPYDYWSQVQENGFMIFAGYIYAPKIIGPYGYNVLVDFAGDPNQLDADMQNFGKWLYEKYVGEPVDLTAEYEKALWAANMDDLLAYLEEKGYIKAENKLLLTTIGTENWLIDGIELIWWDVENLQEGTEPYDYWNEYQQNTFILFGGAIYAPTPYGPFGVYTRADFAGDTKQLEADMKAFGQWLYEKNQG